MRNYFFAFSLLPPQLPSAWSLASYAVSNFRMLSLTEIFASHWMCGFVLGGIKLPGVPIASIFSHTVLLVWYPSSLTSQWHGTIVISTLHEDFSTCANCAPTCATAAFAVQPSPGLCRTQLPFSNATAPSKANFNKGVALCLSWSVQKLQIRALSVCSSTNKRTLQTLTHTLGVN